MATDPISKYEGQNVLLYSDSSNPYESIYIRARIETGCLILTDDEIEHGPDGGSSRRTLAFDANNTRKLLELLSFSGQDPFAALKKMMGYEQRTQTFQNCCKTLGVEFTNSLSF